MSLATLPKGRITQHVSVVGQREAPTKSSPQEVTISREEASIEDATDEDAAKSDDDIVRHDITLKSGALSYSTPSPPAFDDTTPTLTSSSLSTLTDILELGSGEYLVQLSIELKPNKDHIDRLLEGVKAFLKFFQNEDGPASIMPRVQDTRRQLKPLRDVNECQFPTNYL